MQNEDLIPANECCVQYDIEMSFIHSLHEYGLIELAVAEQQQFISASELQRLEKFARMHYELNINMEGIEAINHLLARVELLQEEITSLRNKMSFFSSTYDPFADTR